MAAGTLRREVLKSFKNIHRARRYVFEGDEIALEKARLEINENYRKNINVTDEEKIKELVQFSYDVVKELKFSVIQLREVEPGIFRAQLRPELLADSSDSTVQKCGEKK